MLLVISKPQEHTEQDVLWVDCQTTEGAITIQPGHAPFVALLNLTVQSLLALMNRVPNQLH